MKKKQQKNKNLQKDIERELKQLGRTSGKFINEIKNRIRKAEENNLKLQARLNFEIGDLVEKMDKKASQYFGTSP